MGASCRRWPKRATRSASCVLPITIACQAASPTFSGVDTPLDITVTNGQKSFRPTPSRLSRRAASRPKSAAAFAIRFSPKAALETPWICSSHFEAESPASTPFFANPASGAHKYRWTWRPARASERQSDSRIRSSAARIVGAGIGRVSLMFRGDVFQVRSAHDGIGAA